MTKRLRQFAFGENWKNYSQLISETHIEAAARSISNLINVEAIQGAKILDLGCGSGIHSIAFARLGGTVFATDIDEISIQTTRNLIRKFSSAQSIECMAKSVFEMRSDEGKFDIVYSWGVLHHTGDMWRAIKIAMSLVEDSSNARLILALYRKSYFDFFWKIEKRIYKNLPEYLQKLVLGIFSAFFSFALILQGRNPKTRSAVYFENRGMDVKHDYHDWLGGYPYESVNPDNLISFMKDRGFALEKEILISERRGRVHGIFGVGCDEYVFKKI